MNNLNNLNIFNLNDLNYNCLKYIFSKFPNDYLPWLRMVCKKWANIITHHKCSVFTLLRITPIISIEYINQISNIFPIKHNKCLKIVLRKEYYDEKIKVLEYLCKTVDWNNNVYNFGIIPDLETLKWVESKKFKIPTKIKLNKYNIELLLYHQNIGYEILYSTKLSIPLSDINTMNFPNKLLADIYAKHDIIEKLIPLLHNKTNVATNNINITSLLFTAVKYKSKSCINYLISTYGLTINIFHYKLSYYDIEFINYLFKFPQSTKINYTVKSMLPLSFYKYYISVFGNYDILSWDWVIVHGRIDICDYMEWNNFMFTESDIFKIELYFTSSFKKTIGNFKSIKMLKWFHSRYPTYTQHLINIFCIRMSERVFDWCLNNNFIIKKCIYYSAIKFYSINTIRKILNLNIEIPRKKKLLELLNKRGSVQAFKIFSY